MTSGFVSTVFEFARGHAYGAYALVFLLSMSEALPVVGAVVPGTAVIVGLSALVPSGALDLWPLVICATLGAIAGDGFSYWLGYRYRQTITERWPLSRYPALIARGDAFLQKHGGKSVFIARFTPGVRAIVPMIAGILRMSPARFYTMNVLSAAIWGPSHVVAGALVGATLALLGAIAGRLAIFLVVLLVLFVFVVWAARRAVRLLPAVTGPAERRLLAWARGHDNWLSRQVASLLDPARKEFAGLAFLGATLVAGLWVFFGVLEDVISGDPLLRADAAVFDLLQSLRTGWGDQIMVAVTELGDGAVTIAVTVVVLLWLAWRRAWRAALYSVAAVATASVFTQLLKVILHLPRPNEISVSWDSFSFPSGHTTVAAALYGFLAILVAREATPRWRAPVVIAAALLVSAIAFSRLYLGAHWLSDVLAGLAFGSAWAAFLGIAYLRHNPGPLRAGGLFAAVLLTLAVAGGVHIDRKHETDMVRYAAREEIRTMPMTAWWQGGWSELSVQRVDLLGEFEEPFTVQWAGDVGALEKQLELQGWRVPVPWTIRSALLWLVPQTNLLELPVLPRLESGHYEGLVMVHTVDASPSDTRLVLRLWKSEFSLSTAGAANAQLWIGTVAEERSKAVISVLIVTHELPDFDTPLQTLASAVSSKRQVERVGAARSGWSGTVVLSHDPKLLLPVQ